MTKSQKASAVRRKRAAGNPGGKPTNLRKNICIMNLEKDLQKLKKEKQMKESAIAQLRKRSKDSIARPKAEKNILSNDPRMQRI